MVSVLVSVALVAGGALVLAPALGWNRSLAGVEVQLAPLRAVVYCTAALFAVVANTWSAVEAVRGGRWRSSGAAVAHVGLGLMLLAFLTTGWLGRNETVTLAQGTSTPVLGYNMSFRGVDKPTPAARDAMVVDVVHAGGADLRAAAEAVGQREVPAADGQPRHPRLAGPGPLRGPLELRAGQGGAAERAVGPDQGQARGVPRLDLALRPVRDGAATAK